jgi:hypothetical protein
MDDWRTEYWETLCPKADKAVGEIFANLAENGSGMSVKKAFIALELIPYEYEESEMAKETVNKFIDHIIYHLASPEQEDEIVAEYQKARDEVGLAFWTWDHIYGRHAKGNSFDDFWGSKSEIYGEDLKKLCKELWDEIYNNDTLWAGSFHRYWKHKKEIS